MHCLSPGVFLLSNNSAKSSPKAEVFSPVAQGPDSLVLKRKKWVQISQSAVPRSRAGVIILRGKILRCGWTTTRDSSIWSWSKSPGCDFFLKYISCDPGADPPGVIFFLNIYPVILEQSSWLWAAKLECIVLQPAFRVQFYTSHEISCLAPLSPMLFYHMVNQIAHSWSQHFYRAPV